MISNAICVIVSISIAYNEKYNIAQVEKRFQIYLDDTYTFNTGQ